MKLTTRFLIPLVAAAGLLAVGSAGAAPGDGGKRAVPATIPSNDAILKTIEDLTSKGYRRQGTPALDFAVDYVAAKMCAAGLTGVHVEKSTTYSWQATAHGLSVGGTPIDGFPVAYSQSPSSTATGTRSTPPGGLRAPLVDVGLGTGPEITLHNVKGKIVVFDLKFLLPTAGLLPFTEYLHDPGATMIGSPSTLLRANPYLTTFTDVARAAQDAGAVGFVGVLGDYFNSNKYYNEFYRRLAVRMPGLWVTRAEGGRLRRLMAEGKTDANLTFKTARAKVPAHAVVGYLEGKSKDSIMVQSHHDSVWDGAVEDASGTAEVLALAKHFGAQGPGQREKTLMFTTFDSHFSGYQAHNDFLRNHVFERTDEHRIVGNVTLEHIAREGIYGADGRLSASDLAEPRGVFETLSPALRTELINAVTRNDIRRTAILNGSLFKPIGGIPTDASGPLLAGIPTVSLISGPAYLYDQQDTLDKIIKSDLQPVAQAFAEVIDAMDKVPSGKIGISGGVAGKAATIRPTPAGNPACPSCRAATRGKPVRSVRLRTKGRKRYLTFRARRTGKARIVVRTRSGRRVTIRRSLRACRSYRIRVPRNAVAVRVAGRGGTVRAGGRVATSGRGAVVEQLGVK